MGFFFLTMHRDQFCTDLFLETGRTGRKGGIRLKSFPLSTALLEVLLLLLCLSPGRARPQHLSCFQ